MSDRSYMKLLFEKRFEEAEEVRKLEIPRTLYKYFPLGDIDSMDDLRLSTLENEEIWFSRTTLLNDPYEFRSCYVDEEKLKKIGIPQNMIDVFNTMFDAQHYMYCITCLTENGYDYLPMWGLYTNNSKGFCVEYEVTNPEYVYKVSYEKGRVGLANSLVNRSSAYYRSLKREEQSDDMKLYDKIFFSNLLIKHESWAPESEYRIIRPTFSDTSYLETFVDEMENFFNGDEQAKSNLEKIKGHSWKLEQSGLKTKRIFSGVNCSLSHQKELNRISVKLGCGPLKVLALGTKEYTLTPKNFV